MPYIKESDKKRLLNTGSPLNAGELNYTLTLVVQKYFKENGNNYQAINDVVGALEGAKAEFQRRVVAPYEDRKIQENGDVYNV